MLDWTRTAGQAGDCPEAEGPLRPWLAPAQEVVADAAYDRNALRELVAEAGANTVIKPNAGRTNRTHSDPVAYANRHHMELIINKLKELCELLPVTVNATVRMKHLSVCGLSPFTLIENSS